MCRVFSLICRVLLFSPHQANTRKFEKLIKRHDKWKKTHETKNVAGFRVFFPRHANTRQTVGKTRSLEFGGFRVATKLQFSPRHVKKVFSCFRIFAPKTRSYMYEMAQISHQRLGWCIHAPTYEVILTKFPEQAQ